MSTGGKVAIFCLYLGFILLGTWECPAIRDGIIRRERILNGRIDRLQDELEEFKKHEHYLFGGGVKGEPKPSQ